MPSVAVLLRNLDVHLRTDPVCRVLLPALMILLPFLPGCDSESRAPGAARARAVERVAALPGVILWLWDRPFEKADADPQLGYAPLLGTVRSYPGGISMHPRRASLVLPPSSSKVAVIRVELHASLGAEHCADLTRAVAILAPDSLKSTPSRTVSSEQAAGGFRALQLDFDAPRSSRELYRCLVERLKTVLRNEVPVMVTALPSWCFEAGWLRTLNADLVTPMLYGLRESDGAFAVRLLESGAFPEPECNRSLGISLGDPPLFMPRTGPVFVFDPAGWPEEAAGAVARLKARYVGGEKG